MILEQKIEHLYIEIDKPESLSYSLAEYWNEEIKDTKLIRKSVQILKDIRLPESSKEKTNALYRRIEKKLSAIRQMLKDCVKRYSSADPIDREIYRTALTLFIQDTKYALRAASEAYRQYGMEQYGRNYVLLWKDYLEDYILLEWWTANILNMNAYICLDEETLRRIKDTEGIKIPSSSSLQEKYSSFDIHAENDIEDTHLFLYEYYSQYLLFRNENNDVLWKSSIKIVLKVEPILQKKADELIAMSKQYREYLKIPGTPKDPFSAFFPDAEEEENTQERPDDEDIAKEAANMAMHDLLRSVLGEERMKELQRNTDKPSV